ncbi:MAG: hypothetical protein FJY83_05395 [Candidatus Aminicenantes bacterium]|nr:hypothetical protein [Candidatus Aminicenantes bacterium]
MITRRFIKPAAVIAAVVFSTALPGTAQASRHEVSLSYGIITLDQMVDVWTDILTAVITLGTYTKQYDHFSGAPFLTYRYAPPGRIAFGLALGTFNSGGDLYFTDTKKGAFKETSTIGAAEICFRWITSRSFQLYSGLGAGANFKEGRYTTTDDNRTDKTSSTRFTFHVNFIGFRVGKTLGFFGELGLGYRGIFSLGLNGRF